MIDRPDDLDELLDAYGADEIGDDAFRDLEARLSTDPEARRRFVDRWAMEAELVFALRSIRATDAILGRLGAPGHRRPRRLTVGPRWAALAAGLLLAALGFLAGQLGPPAARPLRPVPDRPSAANVAWLINAQDCLWAGSERDQPGRDMDAGKVLRLVSGLAEIEFVSGARVVLQGPAELELRDANAARLISGAITARVPAEARGFTVLAPGGEVVDLGTEFGLVADGRSSSALHVFEGEVVARPMLGDGPAEGGEVTLSDDQSAKLDGRSVAVGPADLGDVGDRFVRRIVPPPVVTPRTVALDFDRAVPGTIADREGRGTGLTHRLPGTGEALLDHDTNLLLGPDRGILELTTTRSDLNFRDGLPTGEYLGFRLSDLGFTGSEDFAIAATIPEIPGLDVVGQFGLYAGAHSGRNIRGGLISTKLPETYDLFLVNNAEGIDRDLYRVGLSRTGDDLRMTLRRIDGSYSLVVENLTTFSSSTLAIAHPDFLDDRDDLAVGIFGANTRSNTRKTLTIHDLRVTVWTREHSPTTPDHWRDDP